MRDADLTTKLNVGCGYDVKPGWVNLDGYVTGPNIIKHDLTVIPYPFSTNTFDVVYASHVVEHIPHVYHNHNGTGRDVLYSVFEEFYRILKPHGRLIIRTPFGGSADAMCHPQHYRYWYPKTFGYFHQETGTEGSKYHSADLRVVSVKRRPHGTRWPHFFPIGPHGLGLFEHLHIRFPRLFGWLLAAKGELEAVLVANKPLDAVP